MMTKRIAGEQVAPSPEVLTLSDPSSRGLSTNEWRKTGLLPGLVQSMEQLEKTLLGASAIHELIARNVAHTEESHQFDSVDYEPLNDYLASGLDDALEVLLHTAIGSVEHLRETLASSSGIT